MTREVTQTMELSKKEKHPRSKRTKVKVCNICGDIGYSNGLIYCSKCSDTTVHQYCLGILPGSPDDICSWVCEFCSSVIEPESCTCNAFPSASGEMSPCIVHAKSRTLKSKSEIMVFPEQPAVAGTQYLSTCIGNSEKDETSICSQIDEEIKKTVSCSVGDLLNSEEEIIMPRSTDYYDECNAQKRDSASGGSSLNNVEEPEAQVSSFRKCPEHISGEPVVLVKPSGAIISYFGTSSFVKYLDSIMYSIVFMVSPSGEIIICRSDILRDPISVLHEETDADVLGDACFEYPFNVSENMEGDIPQSNEALDVDGLTGMASQDKRGTKRKKTTCDHLTSLNPDCKRGRSKRYKLCSLSERRLMFPNCLLRARRSSHFKDALEFEREEDLINGKVLPQRHQVKKLSRTKVDHDWMTEKWDGKDLRFKPDVHLSSSAPLKVAEGARLFGSLTVVMESFRLLPEGARSIILSGALGPVVASWDRVVQLQAKVDKVLLRGFLERFWDTTNSFHLPFGEVGITMTDFVMISGLPSCGHRIKFNEDLTLSCEGMRSLLGRHLPQRVYKYHHKVPYSFFESYFRKDEGNMDEATDEQNARVWLWYFLGATFFAEKGSRCSTRYLYLLRDLDALGDYNWAAAAYSNYIRYLRAAVRLKDSDSGSQVGLVGPGQILEAWIFAYFPSLRPTDSADPPRFPVVERWAACHQRRVFGSLNDVRMTINGLTTNDFVARPWVGYEGIPEFIVGSRVMDRTRVLLKGPYGSVWFLGERMARQTTTDRFVVPVDPPESMLESDRFRRGEAEEAINGRPLIEFLLPEPDYRSYVALRLAWQAVEVPDADRLSNFLTQLSRLLHQ